MGRRAADSLAPSSRPPAQRRAVLVIGLVLAYVAGVASAFVLVAYRPRPAAAPTSERHEGQQGLINPLLECATGKSMGSVREVEQAVVAYLGQLHLEETTHVSVYFRDLNNGPWFGVNERETFVPSSLNKVQIMVEYLRAAQADPALLQRQITFDAGYQQPEFVPNITGSQQLAPGGTYTVEELVRRMVVYSDNAAARLLASSGHGGPRIDLCPDDSPFPCSGAVFERVSVINYASVFRILYNASYLDRPSSQRALQLLADSEYRAGLVAGVPPGVTVAHKFGEGRVGNLMQLHDCGIVYQSRSPYLLCVMTRGKDLDALAMVIREVSRIAYAEVGRLSERRQ